MKKKLKIALIFGGTSEERKVSLETVKNIQPILENKYSILPIEIDNNRHWVNKLVSNLGKIDVAFLALHGPGGEDGTIQGMLELFNIAYTGSGVLASALAMDKAKTKRIVVSEGVNVAAHVIVTEKNYKKVKLPAVIKPNRIGSSIGVSIVRTQKELAKALAKAFQHDTEVMIEQFVEGREFSVPVLGNKDLLALPVIEIVPKVSEFFDYAAKYQTGGSDEIVPANISKSLAKKLQQIALSVHELLDCKGITRSDFIVNNENVYFLEINTLPGLTANSLAPKSALAAGIPFPKLLDQLIQLALQK